jgi:hypothetical protein
LVGAAHALVCTFVEHFGQIDAAHDGLPLLNALLDSLGTRLAI